MHMLNNDPKLHLLNATSILAKVHPTSILQASEIRAYHGLLMLSKPDGILAVPSPPFKPLPYPNFAGKRLPIFGIKGGPPAVC